MPARKAIFRIPRVKEFSPRNSRILKISFPYSSDENSSEIAFVGVQALACSDRKCSRLKPVLQRFVRKPDWQVACPDGATIIQQESAAMLRYCHCDVSRIFQCV
jgi:hypothetical protein